MDAEERFWSKVDKCAGEDACWPWTGSRTRGGYAQVGYAGRVSYVHRLANTLAIGEIPDGLQLDHVRVRGCADTACCNPRHLEPVTQRENLHRAMCCTEDTCRNGHPRTPEHGKYRRNGRGGNRHWWDCGTCNAERATARAERKRAESEQRKEAAA